MATMTRLFSLLVFLTIILVAFMSLKPDRPDTGATVSGLPWQIETLPEGRSRVFGITLGDSTLGDAREQLGDGGQLAIIVAAGEELGALEMFYPRYKAGVFSGKLVLAADLPAAEISGMMERAIKREYLDSGASKYVPAPEDLALAQQAPVVSIAFIPTVNLDDASATSRFGAASETLRIDEQTVHLLYPDKGLDIILNDAGKDVLQYVAPRNYARLRAPLRKL